MKISLNENHLDDIVGDQHFDRRDPFHRNKSVEAMQMIISEDLSPPRDHPHRPISNINQLVDSGQDENHPNEKNQDRLLSLEVDQIHQR